MSAEDPEPQIAARALLGLWRVQAESLRKHLDAPPARLHDLVTADVRRAARLIDSGLRSFAASGAERSLRPPGLAAGEQPRYAFTRTGVGEGAGDDRTAKPGRGGP